MISTIIAVIQTASRSPARLPLPKDPQTTTSVPRAASNVARTKPNDSVCLNQSQASIAASNGAGDQINATLAMDVILKAGKKVAVPLA